MAATHLGIVLATGDPRRAMKVFLDAAALAGRGGIRPLQTMSLANAAETAIDLGELDVATGALAEAHEIGTTGMEQDGVALFAPTAQAFMHSDSRAANLALKALGPAAPRIAEDAAGQLLDFFGGIDNYVQKNPKQADSLLGPKK